MSEASEELERASIDRDLSSGDEELRRAISEQVHAHDVVQSSSSAMREVALQIRSTIQSQDVGSGRIRDSVGGVLEASESIRTVLRSQEASCSEVVQFLKGTIEATRSNDQSAEQLSETTRELVTQAKSLRDEMRNFKL